MQINQLTSIIRNKWLTRITLAISAASALFSMFIFSRIDTIVNVDLYKSGLQLSSAWYDPYSIYAKLIYAALGAPAVLCMSALVMSFIRKKDNTTGKNITQESASPQEAKIQQLISNSTPIIKPSCDDENRCPHCNKTFTNPLVLMDFARGKPVLVSTCPYCYGVVNTVNKEKAAETDVQIQIADTEKEKTQQSP